MTDPNRPRAISIQVIHNLESGETTMQGPDNALLCLHVLALVQRMMIDKLAKPKSAVQVAGAAALRALPEANGHA